MKKVNFSFHTGIRRSLFTNVTLWGSWDASGLFSTQWSSYPMKQTKGSDGSYSYSTTTSLADTETGRLFEWGVKLDGPGGKDLWAIASEVDDSQSNACVRRFVLQKSGQKEAYYLTHLSLFGANILKAFKPDKVRFAVWAPNAQAVSLAIGDPAIGYIGDQGQGIIGRHPMKPAAAGVWEVTIPVENADDAVYMYEIKNDAGTTVYRTDLYSRCQAGSGTIDPRGTAYSGNPLDLDGKASCSQIVDPSKIEHPIHSNRYVSEKEFWKGEFTPGKPLPDSLDDCVIYELHVGAIAGMQSRPGTLDDAIALIPYLEELGVNAVELLPLAEFSGNVGWGYGATHFNAIEYSTGGPDHLKAFVKACHQHGIAVILDVVYNHYAPDAERAQWMYDTVSHEKNSYYWYEGKPSDYAIDTGGYIDNESTGWAPRFCEETVRKLFISSAVAMILDLHIDGFRVDQTTSIHSYSKLHANGAEAVQAKIFGIKFLREWVRTLRLIKPNVFLTAEDHSGWDSVTTASAQGGIGFDAVWYADFYHHLIGDTLRTPNLIANAGYGGNWPLDMTFFGGLMQNTSPSKIVFHESHDECGNSRNQGVQSGRTIMVAVQQNDPSNLTGMIRHYAEARTRFAAGMTLLSAGIPMFFMGEEVGAAKYYTHDAWIYNREDLMNDKNTTGAFLFKFYQDIIRLHLRIPALRSPDIQILHTHNDNRVIAFKRRAENSEALIIATLSNAPFSNGYTIHHNSLSDAGWREIFNSDAAMYRGSGIGNCGATLQSLGGWFNAVVPANGFVVFERV